MVKGVGMVELGGFELGRVHCVDCLEALKQLPDKCIDLVLTDPPYGVGLSSNKRPQKMRKHMSGDYKGFEDTRDYIVSCVVPSVHEMLRVARRVVLTSGTRNMFCYPEPTTIWCLYWPNGAGRGRWNAFNCWQPLLCYGDRVMRTGAYPDTFVTTEQADTCGHPCPKPIRLWQDILLRVSDPTDIILDPFMGSGTTGVAAVQLGRQFLGFEIDPEYCRLANDRIEAARKGLKLSEYRQGQQTLFGDEE